MAKQKGNPNWGKPNISAATVPTVTEFEKMVIKFQLKPNEYVESEHLREWAKRNSHSKYIPESLLRSWGINVEVSV